MVHRLYQPVLDILRQASRDIVMPYYQNLQSHQIDEKTPGDLVTVADRLSEEFLEGALAALLPEAKIVGEEAFAANAAVMDQLADGQVWIIDPIDGTGNYAAGQPPFGILIALAEADETVAGWLYDPLTERICHAVQKGGAFVNGERVVVAEDHPDRPVAALATGFMTEEQRTGLIAAAERDYDIVDIPRCAAEQYPRLVAGTNHVSIFERTLPWDHAAGVLFLNEAGGRCARWDGSAYRPADRRKGLLGASSPKLWDEAAERLGDICRV
ncbi:inositol monophosphatase family protein [Parasphingorhabdus sp.]|uniref:inositol monophosphatase family protein n=1 Tax=Parasphingorhabdus sp. TaxID=2709688 RepID=UPI0030020441